MNMIKNEIIIRTAILNEVILAEERLRRDAESRVHMSLINRGFILSGEDIIILNHISEWFGYNRGLSETGVASVMDQSEEWVIVPLMFHDHKGGGQLCERHLRCQVQSLNPTEKEPTMFFLDVPLGFQKQLAEIKRRMKETSPEQSHRD
jgi:hypothetical protein